MLRSREHGGRLLALELGHLRAEDPIVLGVARGGVPVAREVARELDAPLDVLVAQRVGAPGWPEYTMAAVAEGGAAYLRLGALHEIGMDEDEAAERAARAALALAERVRAYRGDLPPAELAGRTVAVVDDGVATAATACAAARAVRRRGARRVVLAAPVIAEGAGPALRQELDEVVALERPRAFVSVGSWYERFEPVSDAAIAEALDLVAAHRPEELERVRWEASAPPAAEAALIPCDAGLLAADLVLPPGARGAVVFGTGSARDSPRYRLVSRALHRAGLATVRCDLLTPGEREAGVTGPVRDQVALAGRIAAVLRWAAAAPALRGLPCGLYGAGAGAEASLLAVAAEPELVDAVVVRAGQLDTVPALVLAVVRAPVLLVVGSRDANVLSANRDALTHLVRGDLAVVPGATDLFGEPGALEAVARLATEWFGRWLERVAAQGARPVGSLHRACDL